MGGVSGGGGWVAGARRGALLVLALAACLSAGCAEKKLLQPHIVVVVCDALRADHLDMYGYKRQTAPALTEWARGGLVFEQATAPSNWTRPSVHTLFTGRSPAPDRRFGRGEPVPAHEAVLAERLQAAGYETVAVSANPFVSTTLGADRGFDHFVNLGWLGPQQQGRWKDAIASPYVLDRVEYLLSTRAKSRRPVFLYVHLMDPHLPYDPPEDQRPFGDPGYQGPIDGTNEGFRVLTDEEGSAPARAADHDQAVALYDAEILRLDAGLTRLRALVAQHLADRPVVTVVTSDHGEAFGEDPGGHYGHGQGVGENLLRIPLIVHGVRPNGRAPARVGLVDLAPTLAQLAGTEMGAAVDGQPLVTRDGRLDAPAGRPFIAYRALGGDEPGSGELAVLMDTLRAERRDDGWRVYDVASGEDLTLLEPDAVARLRDAATDWLAEGLRRGSGAPPPSRVALPPGAQETLDALGYVGAEH
ncbi:MAG: sulfatase [Planctomycetota bacterium]|jgi:arylsulfatase A-like enzyme